MAASIVNPMWRCHPAREPFVPPDDTKGARSEAPQCKRFTADLNSAHSGWAGAGEPARSAHDKRRRTTAGA